MASMVAKIYPGIAWDRNSRYMLGVKVNGCKDNRVGEAATVFMFDTGVVLTKQKDADNLRATERGPPNLSDT